jgi:hypothetical protein
MKFDCSPEGERMDKAKVDAYGYLLTLLLQRLEDKLPGLIEQMSAGVRSDMAAIDDEILDREHVEAIFAEAMKLLKRATGK